MPEKVLIVDDDENLLKGIRRNLRKKFDLELAFGGPAAKELIDADNNYAVIVSDMQMPDLNGLELLQHARQSSPQSVRIMLTGNADQKTAIDAVNDGAVFRFINKPCEPEELELAVNAALEQYRLLLAEQQVLEQTLNGSIELMSDVLALLDPAAFGRASRNKSIVRSLCDTLGFRNGWQLEAATLFAQIGRATVPHDILQKTIAGDELTEEQQQIFDEHPSASARLVRRIPRLEIVSEIIESQNLTNRDEPIDANSAVAESAALLDLVLAYDTFSLSCTPSEAVKMVAKEDKFSNRPTWITALHSAVAKNVEIQKVFIEELVPGMVLDEDIYDADEILIVTKEQEVTESLIQRLRNFKRAKRKISEPIVVRSRSSQNMG